jgi:hypothetical protein
LFFGCKRSKNNNEIKEYKNNEIFNYEVEDYEYKFNEAETTILDRLLDYGNYYKSYNYNQIKKSFSVKYEEDLIFLQKFSYGDLSDFIETIEFLPDHEIVAMPPIANLNNLKYLEWPSRIKNISTIVNFRNLEFLRINFYEDIEGIDCIFDLVNLKRLWIRGKDSYLMNLKHIGKLHNLEELFIHGITQDGLNNLSNLKQLNYLEIFGMSIEDISPLLNLPNLKTICLYSNHYHVDITPLASSKSLIEIILLFGSEQEYNKFMNNQGKIFSENGISIPPNDWR